MCDDDAGRSGRFEATDGTPIPLHVSTRGVQVQGTIHTGPMQIHWVPLTASSVTTSRFFASKSLTAMLKSSVTASTHLRRASSFASVCSDSVY